MARIMVIEGEGPRFSVQVELFIAPTGRGADAQDAERAIKNLTSRIMVLLDAEDLCELCDLKVYEKEDQDAEG